jgi:hypothetical protein
VIVWSRGNKSSCLNSRGVAASANLLLFDVVTFMTSMHDELASIAAASSLSFSRCRDWRWLLELTAEMMLRTTVRAASRTAGTTSHSPKAPSFRSLSTQPPHLRSRSWKSSAIRWGIAVAGLYYYNTSSVFAEQPHHSMSSRRDGRTCADKLR